MQEEQLYACPECGGTEWLAHYHEPQTQTCTLGVDKDSEPTFPDYTGGTEGYDATEDEKWECQNCTYEIVLGRFVFVSANEPHPEPIIDAIARIQKMRDEVSAEYVATVDPGVSDNSELEAERDTLDNVLNVLQIIAHGKEPEQGKLTEKETAEFYGRSLHVLMERTMERTRESFDTEDEREAWDEEFGTALDRAFDNLDFIIDHVKWEEA